LPQGAPAQLAPEAGPQPPDVIAVQAAADHRQMRHLLPAKGLTEPCSRFLFRIVERFAQRPAQQIRCNSEQEQRGGRVQARAPGLGLVPRLAAPPFGSNFVQEAMQVLENQGHGVVHWSCHHPRGFGCFGA